MHWAAERRWAHSALEPVPPGLPATELPLPWWALVALYRHKFLAATVWSALTAAAGAYMWGMPVVYSAEAIVLLETQHVPAGLMPATAGPRLEARVDEARQRLLSSSHLQTVIEQLRLYANERKVGIAASALAAEMRRSITIQAVVPGASGKLGPFRVAFSSSDPGTAARVANHLARKFMEEISAARHATRLPAADFYSSQLRSAKSHLEKWETALRDFRVRHAAELPEHAESLRSTARRLRDELASLRDQALGLGQEKRALGQSDAARRAQASAGAQARPAASPMGMKGASPRRGTQSDDLRKRLASMLVIYKPEHPDVRRLAAELATAERSEAEAVSSRGAETPSIPPRPDPSPARDNVETVTARVRALEERLEALAVRRAQAAAELGAVEERLQRIPLRQQELAALMRECSSYSEQFRNLATRQQSAELAEAVERIYPRQRVALLDEAQPPARPLGPNRWLVWIAVSFGGLVVGCLVAIARDCEPWAWICSWRQLPATAQEGDQGLTAEPHWSTPDTPAEHTDRLAAHHR